MNYRVIIPSGSASNLERALAALRAAQPCLSRDRIVVVADRLPGHLAATLDVTWIEGSSPFVFSRNVNLGVNSCDTDIVLMADDVELVTANGFDRMFELVREDDDIGILAAGIEGAACRDAQVYDIDRPLCREDDWLSFVCILIPRRTWQRVGPMDERFDGYGFDDVDYSWRVRGAELGLLVTHECHVRHNVGIESVYRRVDHASHVSASNHNERLFRAKWELPPLPADDGE